MHGRAQILLDKPHSNFSFTMVGDQPYAYAGMRDFNAMRRPPQTTVHMAWQRRWQDALVYPAAATGFSWDEARSNFRWEGQFWIYERAYLSNTGSPTQRWNMRREFSSAPTTSRQIYFSAADARFHMKGAQEAWLEVGNIVSGQKDLEFRWWDTKKDGYLDTVEVYRGNNTVPSRVAHFDPRTSPAPLIAGVLATTYNNKVLPESIATDTAVIARLKFITRDATADKYEQAAAEADSLERRRYCLDIARELLYLRVRDLILAQETALPYPSGVFGEKHFRDPAPGDAASGYTLGDTMQFWSCARLLHKLDEEYSSGNFEQFSSTLTHYFIQIRVSMFRQIRQLGFAALVGLSVHTGAQTPAKPDASGFQLLARYRALGGLMATTVAPGPTPGSERLYGSYLYADNTLDVIAVDPATGKADVFHNPVAGEYGARNIAVGPDGDVYLGTLPHAHFLRVDRHNHRMIDLGRPSAAEEYIWDVAFGADHRLYGVTYPGCRLVRYDPATHKLEDLGKMDPTEKYGRWIVAGHDGFMYIGIGTAKANLAVFDTKTGELREVLPQDAQVVGTPKPYIGIDGNAYATLNDRLFQIDGFHLRELSLSSDVIEVNPDTLKDGRVLDLSEGTGTLTITQPNTHATTKLQISYEGEDLQIFRVRFGLDDVLYGSSILPIHFLKVDMGLHRVDQLGSLGGGEVYSFLPHGDRLLMGAYSGLAPLMSYIPGRPVKPAATGNPILVDYAGSDHAWRPQAMIDGPDGRVYVGATAGYGQLESPLLSWTGNPGSIQLHGDIVRDQSVVSLAVWKRFVVGGTTTTGGGGSHPTQTDARIFLWDTKIQSKNFDMVPVPCADLITDLVTAKTGLIYGIAVSDGSHTLFTFDPHTRTILARQALPFHSVIYNGIGLLPDGTIVGLAEEGIFSIDEATHSAKLTAASPVKITGGFDIRAGAIYFVSNSEVYRYRKEARLAH